MLSLSQGRTAKKMHLHVAVLLAFVGPRPNGHQGAHLDGNKKNCAVDNLQWVTPKVNSSHQVLHGTQRFGEDHHNARITEDQVREVRRLRSLGHPYATITARTGVTKGNIYAITKGGNWPHVS